MQRRSVDESKLGDLLTELVPFGTNPVLLIFFEIEVERKLTVGEPALGVSFHHVVYEIRNDALLSVLIPCGFQPMPFILLEGN